MENLKIGPGQIISAPDNREGCSVADVVVSSEARDLSRERFTRDLQKHLSKMVSKWHTATETAKIRTSILCVFQDQISVPFWG